MEPPVPTPAKTSNRWFAFEPVLDRYAIWIALVLVLIASARMIASYDSMSHTIDEPVHLACGMEWLEKHTYTYEPHHPPLTRAFMALLPRIFGSHGHGIKDDTSEGLAILFANGSEESTLALARLGILPFFWIACWVTFACTRWIAGATAAIISTFLITMTPAMLAHGSLATTDMGLAALLWLAVYLGWRWIETPTVKGAIFFGAATGAGTLAKFSMLAFFPASVLVALFLWFVWARKERASILSLVRERLPQLGITAVVAAVVIWAGYRFSFGPVPAYSISLPAPEFWNGILDVKKHDKLGHLTYLMGSVNTVGWPSFFVIALGVKTPVAILVMGLAGILLLLFTKYFGSRGWIAPSMIIGVLVFSSFFSNIKIGTRHVLPVNVGLAIAGGCAAIWLLRRPLGSIYTQGAVYMALVTLLFNSVGAHPSYLAYFNFIAGEEPEEFLVDSDLDWGQDTRLLGKRLREVGAKQVHFNPFTPGDLQKMYGFPPVDALDVNGPKPGWNAVSLTRLKLGLFGDTRYAYDPGFHFWPERIAPVERVGHGILLIHVDR